MRGHLLAFDILTFIEKGSHLEPGLSGGSSNEFHHGVQRAEGVARPLFGNETEQAVFDGIPLRSAGRIVANGHRDAVTPDNGFMKAVLPIVRSVTIAASTVTQQQDVFHAGVGGPAEFGNPGIQTIDGELGGIGRDADDDRAAIAEWFK